MEISEQRWHLPVPHPEVSWPSVLPPCLHQPLPDLRLQLRDHVNQSPWEEVTDLSLNRSSKICTMTILLLALLFSSGASSRDKELRLVCTCQLLRQQK